MQPSTEAGAAGLAAILAEPQRAVVALDFDGTLAPIVADPSEAHVHPDAVPTLARLAPHLAGVAVITGRPVESALELAGFAGVPGLERLTILGHYGAERWDAATGELRTPPPHPGVLALREELPAIVAGAPDGVRIEDKGAALAVHTRRTANPDAVLHALEPELLSAAERLGLAVEPGRFVLELRPPGTDKGDALRGYLAERDAASVLYAGDDLGDIAAFDAVAQWRKDGHPGLLVCAAPTTGEAPVTALASRADLVVQGPEGVVALLGSLVERFQAGARITGGRAGRHGDGGGG